LNYDSQSVDGESASTNNQPSAIGEGWSLSGGGFIERSYVPCSQDSSPVPSSGDQCWKTDNATISFGGHSGVLVKDTSTGAWKMRTDDGSRVDHLVGTAAGCTANGTYDADCWKVTTTDGTQYWFGLNKLPGWASGNATTNSAWTVPVFGNDAGEPCHAATFAASSCSQGWRWNLDYVVDVHGNAEALYYAAETNSYAVNGTTTTSYVRGGQLDHIDYGFTTGNAYAANAASDKMTFAYAGKGRCTDSTGTNCTTQALNGNATTPGVAANYPDVPFDQNCQTGCSALVSPTFWTTGMLTGITTSVLKSGSYQPVDAWTLSHSFPDPGDGTNAALWLTKIGHTGTAGGSISEPDTIFTGITMQNRVWVKDGLAPLDKYRISSIQTSAGAVTSVNYSAQQCTQANAAAIEANLATNTNRCFPQWWTPQVAYPAAPQLDLFHKYVVTSVISDPRTGGGTDQALETDYVYTGTPAWRYDTSPLTPDNKRTWSTYAGYNTVEIRQGAAAAPAQQTATSYAFFQGMDGDRASTSGGTKSVFVTGSTTLLDSLWFAGQTREVKSLTAVGGPALTDTVSTPWSSNITANDGTNQARIVQTGDQTSTATTAAGTVRTTKTVNTFDAVTGLALTSNQTATGSPTVCTKTSYAPTNAGAGLIGVVSEVQTVAADCSALGAAVYPAAAVSDVRSSYDGLAWGATPTKGDETKTQTVKSYTGSTAATAQWISASQTAYDSMGRVTALTDVGGHTSTTTYTPAAAAAAGSGALTSTVTANTLGWTSTVTVDSAWGAQTSVIDSNGSISTVTFDALGRRTAVWYPDHTRAANPVQPNVAYTYTLSQTAPNVVQTDTITATAVVTRFGLYDGLGRLLQTQSPAEGGGTVVSDTWYDTQGRNWVVNNPYWAGATASGNRFVPSTESQIPSETITQYDGAGRTTATVLNSFGAERYRTAYAYPGVDQIDTTPPVGGTPTSAYTDARGNKTQLVQYLAPTISAGATTDTTSYLYDPSGHMTQMTDPAGTQWNWTFDVLGRQVSASDPDSGISTSSFDDSGNLTSGTDARGVTLDYSYDPLNRKTAQSQKITGGDALLASWAYDTVKKGQLASSSSYVGSTVTTPGIAYTTTIIGYDAQYNPTSSKVTIPAGAPAFAGSSYTTQYGYTGDGSLATVNYPAMGGLASERLRYGYDGFGLLASIGTYDSATYSPLSQIAQDESTSTQDVYRGYGYDQANGRLLSIDGAMLTGSTLSNQQHITYAYDNAGRVTSTTATSAATPATDTQCFKYDYLSALTQAFTPASGSCAAAPAASSLGGPAPYWTDYQVSAANGNRLSAVRHDTAGGVTTSTYSYPTATAAHPHAVSQVVSTGASPSTGTYNYDNAGNNTTRGTGAVAWNAIGKPASVTQGSTSQSNVYGPDGSLLLQTDTQAGATLFLGATELHIAAGTSTVTATRTYTRGTTPIAERSTQSGSTVLTWLLADQQDSVTAQIADGSGALSVRRQDPFGQVRTGSSGAWGDGHGYLNATTSVSTGLTQLGARLYDSALGRFISVDSVLAPNNPQQNNGYSYGANNPVTFSDPSGLCYMGNSGDHFYAGACGAGTQDGGTSDPQKTPSAAGNSTPRITVSNNCHFDSNCYTPHYVKNHASDLVQYSVGMGQMAANRDNPSFYAARLLTATSEVADAAYNLCMTTPESKLCGATDGGVAALGVTARAFAKSAVSVEGWSVAADSGMAGVRAAGRTGEELAGIVKNTEHIPSVSGSAAYRIPDELNSSVLGEVKNVSRLSYTNQLRDFAAYAGGNGLQFNLYVRGGTQLSGPLQQAVDAGGINLIRNLP
jgi:RHS repeat-associated protein